MSLFSEIERSIERGFKRWSDRMFGEARSAELLVIHREILDEIESKIQTAGRGERLFPYASVTVTLISPDPERRALYQTAFADRLRSDIHEALTAAGCGLPEGFSLEVETAETGERPLTVEYRVQAPKPAIQAAPPRLVLVRGKTECAEYTLDKPRINIGRMAELTDAEQRVVRRNDIVFPEGGDEVNATVSRTHAHLRLENGHYRICDDGSEFGTRVFRNGRAVDVPPGNRRGEKLRPGDEIYLGRACLRFEP
jgi:hypothetical protein